MPGANLCLCFWFSFLLTSSRLSVQKICLQMLRRKEGGSKNLVVLSWQLLFCWPQTVFKNCCLVELLDCFHGEPVFSAGLSQSPLQPVYLRLPDASVSCQTVWAWSSSPNTDICSCLFFSEVRTMSCFLCVAHHTLCALFLGGIWCPLNSKNKSVNLYFFVL